MRAFSVTPLFYTTRNPQHTRSPFLLHTPGLHHLLRELLHLAHSPRRALLEGNAIQPLAEVDGVVARSELTRLLVLHHGCRRSLRGRQEADRPRPHLAGLSNSENYGTYPQNVRILRIPLDSLRGKFAGS